MNIITTNQLQPAKKLTLSKETLRRLSQVQPTNGDMATWTHRICSEGGTCLSCYNSCAC